MSHFESRIHSGKLRTQDAAKLAILISLAVFSSVSLVSRFVAGLATIEISPLKVDLGSLTANECKSFTVTVTNMGPSTQIVGCNGSCGCLAPMAKFPIELPTNESVSLAYELRGMDVVSVTNLEARSQLYINGRSIPPEIVVNAVLSPSVLGKVDPEPMFNMVPN